MNFQGQHRRAIEEADAIDADAQAAGVPQAGRKRSRYAWLGTLASAALFIVSVVVLWHLSQDITWAQLQAAMAATTGRQFTVAFGFVVVSYLFLTGYDALALRQLRIKVPYSVTALASFTSYAVSFTLGFALFTAGTIRYWI